VNSLRQTWHRFLCACVAVVICSALIPLLTARAAPTSMSLGAEGDGRAIVTKSSISVPPTGALDLDVSVELPAAASYLEARVRLYSPDGPLIYQKTEVLNDVTTSTVSFAFEKELTALDMTPNAYPIEVRVGVELAEDGRVIEHIINENLLVHDPERAPMALAAVVRIGCAPALDPSGRFAADPIDDTHARAAVNELSRHILDDPGAVFSIAIAPVLIEEWSIASQGYETIGAGGVRIVGPDEPGAIECAETLDLLRQAIETGRLELLDVPFADPDLEGLDEIGLMSELQRHYERGRVVYETTLGTLPVEGTAILGDTVSESTLSLMADSGIDFVILSNPGLGSHEETCSTGVYTTPVPSTRALVIDSDLSEALTDGDSPTALRFLFDRAISTESTTAAIAIVEFGPGRNSSPSELIECIKNLRSTPWLVSADARSATSGPSSGVIALPSTPHTGKAAPRDYWPDVERATHLARAFELTTGVLDPEAISSTDSAMRAQSRCWAGPDDGWGLIDRGRAHSAAALRIADSYLGAVSISAPDLTLSSSSGRIPISIVNASDKNLLLTVDLSTTGLALGSEATMQLTVRPSENFLTIPVDLQSSISGKLGIAIRSGETILTSHTVSVRASYLDRLAIIAGVVILLGTLLAFIRKRALSAQETHTDTPVDTTR
jgi:hypothetical protein